jgi:hypothetical protein
MSDVDLRMRDLFDLSGDSGCDGRMSVSDTCDALDDINVDETDASAYEVWVLRYRVGTYDSRGEIEPFLAIRRPYPSTLSLFDDEIIGYTSNTGSDVLVTEVARNGGGHGHGSR